MDPNTLNLLKGAAGAGSAPYDGNVVIAHEDSPFISVFPFTSEGGFGTRYTNPSSLPSSHRFCGEFSPDGNYVAVGGQTSPRFDVYEWSSSGFGSNEWSQGCGDTVRDVSWHPDSDAVVVVQEGTSPYVLAWPWSSSGFGAQFSDPSSGPSSSTRGVAFNPVTGNSIILSGYNPYLAAWAWSSSGFGTKYSNPSASSGVGWDCAFSPDGTYVLQGSDADPHINVYPWDDSSGFGTRYTQPSTLPGDATWGVAMNPDNTAVASAGASTYIDVWAWSSSGFGTKYSNPSSGLPSQRANDVAWTPDGAAIILVYGGGVKVSAWPWDDSTGFGTKFSDPSQSVYDAFGVAFQPF